MASFAGYHFYLVHAFSKASAYADNGYIVVREYHTSVYAVDIDGVVLLFAVDVEVTLA